MGLFGHSQERVETLRARLSDVEVDLAALKRLVADLDGEMARWMRRQETRARRELAREEPTAGDPPTNGGGQPLLTLTGARARRAARIARQDPLTEGEANGVHS